jgi:hypothetical protein
MRIQGCYLFMKSFKDEKSNRLFLSSLESLAEDKTKNLENELHQVRNRK